MLKSRKTGQTNTHSNLKQIPETAMNCKGFESCESCVAFDLAFELGD